MIVIWLCGLLSYYAVYHFGSPEYAYFCPVAVMVFVIAYTLVPFKTLHWRSRWWFLRTLVGWFCQYKNNSRARSTTMMFVVFAETCSFGTILCCGIPWFLDGRSDEQLVRRFARCWVYSVFLCLWLATKSRYVPMSLSGKKTVTSLSGFAWTEYWPRPVDCAPTSRLIFGGDWVNSKSVNEAIGKQIERWENI